MLRRKELGLFYIIYLKRVSHSFHESVNRAPVIQTEPEMLTFDYFRSTKKGIFRWLTPKPGTVVGARIRQQTNETSHLQGELTCVCVCVSTDVCLHVCVSADVCLRKQQITNKQAKYMAYETVLPNSRSNQKVNRDTEHGACLSFIL